MTFILFFTGLFTKSGLAALTTKYTKTQQTVFTMKLFGVLHISSGQALSIQVRNYYCYLYIFFNKGAKKLALNLVFWVLRWSFYAVSRRTLFLWNCRFYPAFQVQSTTPDATWENLRGHCSLSIVRIPPFQAPTSVISGIGESKKLAVSSRWDFKIASLYNY